MQDPAATHERFVFPRWVNWLLPLLLLGAVGGATVTPPLVFFGLSASTLNVGYRPEQPVYYSHELHVGELGMDCRYCHTTVDDAAFAAIPPTETCIACHAPGTDPQGQATNLAGVHQNSPKLEPVWTSYFTGEPIPWVEVHDIADYAYFNHAAHVNKGVGCYSCHGRVDRMDGQGVWQVHELSMAWCIDCHREPEQHLRPVDQVTNMVWHLGSDVAGAQGLPVKPGQSLADAQLEMGLKLKEQYQIHNTAYMQSCSTCHR